MPSPPPKKYTLAERQRVLAAFRAQRSDWLMVAAHNGVPRPTEYRWTNEDRDQLWSNISLCKRNFAATPHIRTSSHPAHASPLPISTMTDNLLAGPALRPTFSPRQIAAFYFKLCLDEEGEPTGYYACKTCAKRR
ncbi:hypothetical protein ON010_g15325 [Phytophthora cinnamomi]|nr:hypothetical protein ON010_g15325 [Phytophthora cinnamomi]